MPHISRLLRWTALLILVLVIVPWQSASGQNPTRLEYGDIVEGNIGRQYAEVSFTFEGAVNDVVSIWAAATDPRYLDLGLRLRDPSGAEIAANDDTYGLNPALENVALAQAGVYTIAVYSVSGTGPFDLTLLGIRSEPLPTVQPPETPAIDTGILFQESFDNNSRAWETLDRQTTVAGITYSELVEGEYVMELEWEDDLWWLVTPGFGNWSAAPIFAPPYEFQVEVTLVQSRSGNYRVGVMFNYQEAYGGGYWFWINQDGDWQYVFVRPPGPDRYYFEDGQTEPVDFTDGATHVIRARIEPNRFTFWVDDQLVGVKEFDYPLFWATGTIGILAGPDLDAKEFVVAHFDNLIVYRPNPEPEFPRIIG